MKQKLHTPDVLGLVVTSTAARVFMLHVRVAEHACHVVVFDHALLFGKYQ